jgi:hypothetical protein
MTHIRRQLIPQQPQKSWRERSADQLKTVREALGRQVQDILSDYTNQHLWVNAKYFVPASIIETDPLDIQDLKACFGLLYSVEYTLRHGNDLKIPYVGTYQMIIPVNIPVYGIYHSLSHLPSFSRSAQMAWNTMKQLINLFNTGEYQMDDVKRLAYGISDRIKTFLSFRRPAPFNPALSFQTPPPPSSEWWSDTPAPAPTDDELVNFEFDYLLNPVRKLLSLFDLLFPELELKKIPFKDHQGFLDVPAWETTTEQFRKQKTLKQSLAALYNLTWAVNRVGRSYLTHSKVRATLFTTDFALEALENLWLIDFSRNISDELQAKFKTKFRDYLENLHHRLLNIIPPICERTYHYEVEHHLKIGTLSRSLRYLFDQVADFYLAYGIHLENPFAMQPSKATLQQLLEDKKTHEEKTHLESLKNQCEIVENQLFQILSIRALPKNPIARDKLLKHAIQNLTSLLITENLQPLDKANLFEIQDLLIHELSHAGIQSFLNETKEREEPALQHLATKLENKTKADSHPTLTWIASVGALLNAYTPEVLRFFITSLIAPPASPAAFSGQSLSTKLFTHDLCLTFSIGEHQRFKNIVLLVQEQGELVCFNVHGEKYLLLNEKGIEKEAPFLKHFLDRGTQRVPDEKHEMDDEKNSDIPMEDAPIHTATQNNITSIKHELSSEELTRLDHIIFSKTEMPHFLQINYGFLDYLKKTHAHCTQKLHNIYRQRETIQEALAQPPFDVENHYFRATMRLIEPQDLLKMIYAVQQTQDHSHLNRDIKNRLAALIADSNGENRQKYIVESHLHSNYLIIKNPAYLVKIIKGLFEHPKAMLKDKLLCRELLIQIAITNIIPFEKLPTAILQFQSPSADLNSQAEKQRNDKLLSQFDTEVFGEEKISNPAIAILNLAINHAPITARSVKIELETQGNIKNSHVSRYHNILNSLYQLHNKAQADPALQYKIGIFMANIALRNALFARFIFSDTSTPSPILTIIQKACLELPGKNKSLYYEAWVNSLAIHYGRTSDAPSLVKIVEENKSIFIQLHQIMHRTTAIPVIDPKNNAWELCKLVANFITQYLSPESHAESVFRRLFLNMIFDNTPVNIGHMTKILGASVRKELTLRFFDEGRSNLPYYMFVSSKYNASETQVRNFNAFWKEAKENLLHQIMDTVHTLKQTRELFMHSISSSKPTPEVKFLIQRFDDKVKEINDAYNDLIDAKSKIDSSCYRAHRNFTLSQQEAYHVAEQIHLLISKKHMPLHRMAVNPALASSSSSTPDQTPRFRMK